MFLQYIVLLTHLTCMFSLFSFDLDLDNIIITFTISSQCVNVGCVPKKIMFAAATMAEMLKHESAHYGFETAPGKIDWKGMKEKRDKYIARLNNLYWSGLDKAGIAVLEGWASFEDSHTVSVAMKDGSTKLVTAEKIMIATGGKPMIPPGEGIAEYAITSDGFFELEEQPEKVVVVGAGYIAGMWQSARAIASEG